MSEKTNGYLKSPPKTRGLAVYFFLHVCVIFRNHTPSYRRNHKKVFPNVYRELHSPYEKTQFHYTFRLVLLNHRKRVIFV